MKLIPVNYLPVLKSKNFVRLWISHILSQVSTYTLLFIIISRTFDLTTSTIATGMVWISFTLPTVLLSPFSGSLVDIWNKRKTLTITYLIHAFIILLFAVAFFFNKYQLVHPLIFFYALIAIINDPAELAEIPQIIKKKKNLMSANSIIFFTDQASFILSSAIAGILLRFIPLTGVILIMAIMPLGASFSTYFLPKGDKKERKMRSLSIEIEDFLVRVKLGYKFIRSQKLILYGFSLIIFFRVFLTISILLLPSLSKNVLGISVYDAGYTVILPIAFGLALGTLILNKTQKKRKKEWIGSGMTLLGINFILFLTIVPGNMIIRRIVGIILSVILGACASVVYAPAQTFIHEFTPANLRGRTFSSLIFFTTIVSIPSILMVTTLAEIFGTKYFLISIGLAISLLGILIIKKGNEIILATNNRT